MRQLNGNRNAAFFYLICGAIVVCLLVSGCAKFSEFFGDNELMLKASVELAVAVSLDRHPDWKSSMIAVSDEAMNAIDKGVVLDLASVSFYVKKSVRLDEMTPLTRVAVSNMIDGLMAAVMENLKERSITLPELQLVEVKKVLTWVNNFAQLSPDVQRAKVKAAGK